MNTFGEIFRLTTFGESHGTGIGGVVDGMPAGVTVDEAFLAQQMARRAPGQSAVTTSRREADRVSLLSGVYEGRTLGTPIGFIIPNSNVRSTDYDVLRTAYRPSHADYTYEAKYGHRDHRGGGRASARETAARVVGGALAMMALKGSGISISAYTSTVGTVELADPQPTYSREEIDATLLRTPACIAAEAEAYVASAMACGDTVGGVITCRISGVPAGLGDPVFGKLQARLAAAMMSIPAAKGFEYGMGFDGCRRYGSEVIDLFVPDGRGGIATATNNSGGIQGGISNGADIVMRIAFKPVATLLRPLPTVDNNGQPTELKMRGRHDPCVLPRAVPVVEAMAAMTILDAMLLQRTVR